MVALALILFHFFLPFFLLLNRESKRQSQGLWKIAVLILVHARCSTTRGWCCRRLRSSNPLRFWAVIPAFAGIGGLWAAVFTWQLKGKPLVPRHDPMLADGLVHHGRPPTI